MARARGGQFVLMALRGPYAPVLPELDPFLFAAVGEEVDGIPLSMLSALSRLGLDPRGEAARLSHLAGEAAADQLARTIARLPETSDVKLALESSATEVALDLPAADRAPKSSGYYSSSGLLARPTRGWRVPVQAADTSHWTRDNLTWHGHPRLGIGSDRNGCRI